MSSRQVWLRWLPAIFFATAIFIFSSIPGKDVSYSFHSLSTAVQVISPTGSHTPVFAPQIDWLKVGHGIGYFCLGFTVLLDLTIRSRWSLLTALVICSFYAITDEFHQAFVPGRSPAGRDVLLDSLAAFAGIVILLGIAKWQAHIKSTHVAIAPE